MKTLCFALLLSQHATEEAAPPSHIQDLLKKRILYQIKQQDPDLQFYFDESTCDVVGTYEYANEAVAINSNDQSVALHLSYTDVLAGKKLELGRLTQVVETRAQVVAAVSAPATMNPSANLLSDTSRDRGGSVKKWLPWVIGAVGLSLGGWAIYNSMERKGGSDPASARRRR